MNKTEYHLLSILNHANALNKLLKEDDQVRDLMSIIDTAQYIRRSIALNKEHAIEAFADLRHIENTLRKLQGNMLIECIDEISTTGGSNTNKHTKPLMTAALQMEVNA